MTQPAAPPEPPIPTAAHSVPGTPDFPPGVTANFKNVTVRPWRQSTAVLAVVAQMLFVVAAVANLYLASVDLKVMGLLDGRDFAAIEREAQGADGLYGLILGVGSLAGVFLLVWFHRVWTSDRSDHSLYTRGTGLAVGGWFIPFANLVLGPLALRDLMWGTEHASPRARPGRPAATPRLVIAFWVVIGVNVVLVILGRGTQSGLQQPESLDALMSAVRTSLTYEALAGLAGAAGSVVAILIIRQVMRYTRR